jgi:hypothetical protein
MLTGSGLWRVLATGSLGLDVTAPPSFTFECTSQDGATTCAPALPGPLDLHNSGSNTFLDIIKQPAAVHES